MGATDEQDTHVQEAADWFARLNARSVSVSDLERFRVWAADPVRRRAYDAVEQVWRSSDGLRDDRRLTSLLGSALKRRRPLWRGWLAPVLAAGVLASVVGFFWAAARPVVLRTDVGERRSVRLDDGSRVQLDTATLVEVSLRRNRRSLRLVEGQALFDVARDPARPFLVRAGDAEVTATGTRFDIRLDAGQAQVTLIEGGVLVEDEKGARWRLHPGQRWMSADARAVVTPVDVRAALGWTEGRLVFTSTPLSKAARDINRYGDRPVRIGRGVDRSLPVSGAFDTGDSAAFAQAVAELHGLQIRILREEIVLSARNPSASS